MKINRPRRIIIITRLDDHLKGTIRWIAIEERKKEKKEEREEYFRALAERPIPGSNPIPAGGMTQPRGGGR